MEFILGLLVFYGFIYVAGQVLGQGARAAKAAAKTATQGGSFADNFSNKIQFKIEKLPPDKDFNSDIFGVFVKGSPDISVSLPVTFIFQLNDKEANSKDGGGRIISTLEDFTAPNSRLFEQNQDLGDMNGKYWPDWSRIAVVIPDTLIGPYKGTRKLQLSAWLWFSANLPDFWSGKSSGGINIFEHDFEIYLPNSGYLEIDKERLEVQKASVELAVSIAFADGSLDDSEGNTIKKWIKDIVDSALPAQKDKTKESLNASLEKSFKQAQAKELNTKIVCKRIENIGSKVDKYDLLELCLDVMAADGEADKEELKQITEISKMIGVDYDEVTKMKDQRLIKLDPSSNSSVGIEEKLGIDPEWDEEKIKKHIISEYSKWNGRLNTLPEGIQRDNAQSMLDLLAEARKKYS